MDEATKRLEEAKSIGLVSVLKMFSDERVLNMFLIIQTHQNEYYQPVPKNIIRETMGLDDEEFEEVAFKLTSSNLAVRDYTDDGQYFRLKEFPSLMIEGMIKNLKLRPSRHEKIDTIVITDRKISIYKCECGNLFGIDKNHLDNVVEASVLCTVCKRHHLIKGNINE